VAEDSVQTSSQLEPVSRQALAQHDKEPSPDASMSSLMTEDFIRNIDKLDMAGRQAVLEQLLAEYDRSEPGAFPFPRSAISEFIMRDQQPVSITVP